MITSSTIEEYLDLLRKIVWRNLEGNEGLFEFEDLFSQACIIYLETEAAYDPEKAKKSTFIFHVVNNELKNIIKRERARKIKEHQACEIFLELKEYEYNPEQKVIAEETWAEALKKVSPDARAICNLLIYENIYLPTDKPKLCRGIIKNELRKRGWKWNDIWRAFGELKNTMDSIA